MKQDKTTGVLGLIMKPFSYLVGKCKESLEGINADILWTVTQAFEKFNIRHHITLDRFIEHLDGSKLDFAINLFDTWAFQYYGTEPELMKKVRLQARTYLMEA